MDNNKYAATIISTKGGVGKTTTAANVGPVLADLGYKVCWVDTDSRPNLSGYYPITNRADGGLTQLLTTGNPAGCISQTSVGCDLIISDDRDGKLQNWLLHQPDGRARLKFLKPRLLQSYDVVIIDTEGGMGPLQESAMLAGDLLLSPVPTEALSLKEFMRGMTLMYERLDPMAMMGMPLAHLYLVLNRVTRTRDAQDIVTFIRSSEFMANYQDRLTVLNTEIPDTTAYTSATTARVPVHLYERRRSGPTRSARETMETLVAELFPSLLKTQAAV